MNINQHKFNQSWTELHYSHYSNQRTDITLTGRIWLLSFVGIVLNRSLTLVLAGNNKYQKMKSRFTQLYTVHITIGLLTYYPFMALPHK